ncbi:MAG: TIGR02281 family clan AA aspartic protease [Deltaproteobacteria bacterium]|nr:TIGR02281 family clan AA aspartic protease [Deltaproteobacteria bacterium]MBI2348371.1 TIGR02281 family clan AA aspartic protease [Deltaproteobacteria bacterium]MBI2992049.1 TIGR02281 family clan AA aspartic protease [Deltaproteobacteria bacterium]MBI3063036.1 TIGR02281 family clan AA aspartic protease [Deltaproteobacteria bacterium]
MMRPYGILIAALLLAYAGAAFPADILRWTDEKGVVHFTDNLHNIPEKFRSGVTRIKAKESPRSPEAAKPIVFDKASVPFQKRGTVVVVPATINEKATVRFVVDTGASYTMISQATAKELEIDLEKKHPSVPFQTANGTIQAPLVSLSSIDVGGLQVKDLTAAVHDVFPDPSISGLLGLNFLSNFRMEIDTQNGVLHLERK